jgi:5-carboxymethyl-2-hydroxymuconate isomerase
LALPLAEAFLRLRGSESPGSLIFVGLNYSDHQAETPLPAPGEPAIFAKLPNAVIGDGDPVVVPAGRESRVDYEGELAVLIGRRTARIEAGEALSHVFGYTIVNDITDRGVQFDRDQLILGKGIDTFCPLGPSVALADEVGDPGDLRLTTAVNGELRQDASTSTLIFSISELIAFISHFVTLQPGDVVSTGTPAGCGAFRDPPTFLQPGDEVVVAIEGIGELRNPIVAA